MNAYEPHTRLATQLQAQRRGHFVNKIVPLKEVGAQRYLNRSE